MPNTKPVFSMVNFESNYNRHQEYIQECQLTFWLLSYKENFSMYYGWIYIVQKIAKTLPIAVLKWKANNLLL